MKNFINKTIHLTERIIVTSTLIVLFVFACEKFEPEEIVKVSTGSISYLSYTECTIQGTIIDNANKVIDQHGFCWSISQKPNITNDTIQLGSTNTVGKFTGKISGLTAGTTYYISAYAQTSSGIYYGTQDTFKTHAYSIPTVFTTTLDNVTSNSAEIGGNVTDNGGKSVINRGICWADHTNPKISDNAIYKGDSTGSFVCLVTGLLRGTTYYVRAFATNSEGTNYGDEDNFQTLPTIPTVNTSSIFNKTNTSAEGGGNVTDDGGGTLSAVGVCWSTFQDPTITIIDSITIDGNSIGSFNSTLTGLKTGRSYYVRAYATNSAGTGYGNEEYFTTIAAIPTVTTSFITNITENSAQCGGNVTDGGGTILEVGICWGTNPDPTISDYHTSDGNTEGDFNSSISGLSPGTKYFVRSYATNSIGTAYGANDSLCTSVIDYDGNIYKVVAIGTQFWMAENLKTKHFNNGDPITLIVLSAIWGNTNNPGFCYYGNDETRFKNTYGALYNWYTVNTGKLCPVGWHVPTDSEWTTLIEYLGGENIAGGKLKEVGTSHWQDPNTGATNESGFSGLPGGYRSDGGIYLTTIFIYGFFWGSTEDNLYYSWSRGLDYTSQGVQRDSMNKKYGFSIRCIKE